MNIPCFNATRSRAEKFRPSTDHSFDTDSFLIGIDSHASYSLTNNKEDFIDTPRQVRVGVKGIAGRLTSAYVGTVRWSIEDDAGEVHQMDIPNTYFVRNLPIRLLSPQHLAQELASKERTQDGTSSQTFANREVLTWMDRMYKRTVPLNNSNVAVFRSAPAFTRHAAFEALYDSASREPKVFQSHLIPPDEMDETEDTAGTLEVEDNDSGQDQEVDLPDETYQPSRKLKGPTSDQEPRSLEGDSPDVSRVSFSGPDQNTASQNQVSLIEDDEFSPTIEDPTRELLLWHYRLGHLPFARLQAMARAGDLPRRLTTCRVPECAACRLGKATKVPWRTKGKNNTGAIHPVTAPGQCISVDQLESTTPGFIAQLKGRATRNRYKYVTVFVDHFSGHSFTYLQKRITSDETVRAKVAYEAYAKSLGVTIKHYHADNGRFADNAFLRSVADCKQTISFCGVNAHFQNGRAEKKIRDLQDLARTQLIHAKHRWPAAVEVALWPYALRHANDVHNSTVTLKGQPAPIELFSQSGVQPKIKHFHPFACPVYVLDNNLQSGKALPKWDVRSRVGLYLGSSPKHARSVSLVLNLATGMVSPQYHVRFDSLFETLKRQRQPKSEWQRICHFRSEKKEEWQLGRRGQGKTRSPLLSQAERYPDTSSIPLQQQATDDFAPPQGQEDSSEPEDHSNEGAEESSTISEPSENEAPQPTQTRSGRTVHPPSWHTEFVAHQVEFETIDQDLYVEEDKMTALDDPILYANKASNDPDTLYMHEALRAPDAAEFKEAMVKEVVDHTERGHWEVIPKSDLPAGETILPAVWSMRRKRRIATREVYKWKSRLTLGGHKMIKGKHYEETYAPSLSWGTIRLFLILTIMHGWKSRQLDFVLAYPHADIPRPTFMELPRGINFPGGVHRNKHCLRLKKNIYGGKDSGRTWYLYLKSGLESIGFERSEHDPCVFYRGTNIVLVYTDDLILLDKDSEQNIDKAVDDLSTIFRVDDGGSIDEYLGVKVQRLDGATISLTQPQLIDSILIDLQLLDEDGRPRPNTLTKDLPCMVTKPIGPDPEGEPFNEEWDYRSVIGKLNFLEKSTRGEIAYAVHQCARFASAPKASHGKAIKHIGRYLLKTRDKGLLLKPDPEESFECFVDADFSGNWDKRIADKDPNTAKSRSGFVIKYAGVPLYWASKMQTQFALSTAESEYIALSTATRDVKATMYLLEEINEKVVPVIMTPVVSCRCFEDNSAALEMARIRKLRPRTRHINSVYHHFRNEVANKRLIIQAIGTALQQADIFTKACDKETFERHRKAIFGW